MKKKMQENISNTKFCIEVFSTKKRCKEYFRINKNYESCFSNVLEYKE